MNREIIIRKAILTYGAKAQMMMCIEEAAELIQAINKYFRATKGNCNSLDKAYWNLAEEIADVQIMIEQMRIIFGKDVIDMKVKEKLCRLETRMREEQMI